MVYNLVDRALFLSDRVHHKKNLNFVKYILHLNSYPPEFIDNHVKKRIAINFNKISDADNNSSPSLRPVPLSRPSIHLKIPYNPSLYHKLSQRLRCFDIGVVPSLNNKLDRFIKRGKDKTDPVNRMSVVYKINCHECDAVYVGQTKKSALERCKQHRSNSKYLDRECVINSHIKECGHLFDFDNPIVLEYEKEWKKRIISETIYINSQTHSINKIEDSRGLSRIYGPIIEIINNKNLAHHTVRP